MLKESLNSFNTGLILYDASSDQPVLDMNIAARQILALDKEALNSGFANLQRTNESLARFFEELNNGNLAAELKGSQLRKHKRIELSINGQYFSIYISLLEDKYLLEFTKIIQKDIGHTTHELKRPIQNIKTSVETLLMGAKDDPKHADKFLQNINFEVDRLGDLVNDILRLTQLQTGSVELKRIDLNLKEAVDKVIKSLKNKAEAKFVIIENKVEPSFTLNADKELLNHLLENLIDNAIKYNKENGKVEITGDADGFLLKDTGIGMPKEALEKLGEQFYRVENAKDIQGSGLGISIVKNILDLHGWKLKIESELDKGSAFRINIK